MWVICINSGKCRGATSNSVSLTVGKKYWVDYVTTGLQREYKLKNDIGEYRYYSPNRFVNVEQHRDNKIIEILK